LAERGLDALDRVEVAVLAEQRLAERGLELPRLAPSGEVARDQLARLVHLLLLVEKRREGVEQLLRVGGAVRLRKPRRRDVEEAVEVDAHRGVERAAQQLG